MAYSQRFIALGVVFLSMLGIGARHALSQGAVTAQVTPNAKDIAAYRIFFRRIATYKQMSDDAASAGQDKSYLMKSLQERVQLGDSDMMNLQIVALQCEADLAPLNAQVKTIIAQFRYKFPNNKVPVGANLAPPPELHQVELSQNSIILKYRNLLATSIRTDHFQSADIAIRSTYGNPAAIEQDRSAASGVN